jgi:hypothetical protein
LVGCAGNANDPNGLNYQSFGDSSFLAAHYGFSAEYLSYTNLVPNTGRNYSGLTMENFFQSILNSENSNLNAGDIISNSLSSNFTYNRNSQVIDLSPTGVAAGRSCTNDYTETITRSAPVVPLTNPDNAANPAHSGSDNSTTQTYSCLPIFTVDKFGRISSVTSRFINYDAIHGNEVVGVTGTNSGLVRSGAGTFADPYTLALSIGDGLRIEDNKLTILIGDENLCSASNNNPQLWLWDGMWNSLPIQTNIDTNPLTGNQAPNRLAWDGRGFACVHDTDNQQLSLTNNSYLTSTITHDNTYDSINGVGGDTDTHSTVTKYSIGLSGDESSFIQFVDRDTFYTQERDSGSANNDGTSANLNNNTFNATSGLSIDNTNHTIAINAPYCTDFQKTVWKKDADDANSHFECIYTTDRIIRGNETGYVNSLNNGLTITDNNDGTTTISITDTGVIVGHYGNNWLGSTTTDSNGVIRPTSTDIAANDAGLLTATTFKLPVFTLNAQGQIVGIQNQTITKARLSDTATSGLTLIGDGSITSPYNYSINLTTNGGLVKGGTGQLGTTDQLEFKSCPAGYVLASKGLGQGYDCFHIDALENVNQTYHAGTSMTQVLDWQPCTVEVFSTGHCFNPESGVYNPATAIWTYTPCTAYNNPSNCSYQAGGTFSLKYDATKGLTITQDNNTGSLAIKLNQGLSFDQNGQIEINLDNNSGLMFNESNGKTLRLNIPTCTPTSTAGNGANNPSTATKTDNSGRITWTGTAFDCQRITDTQAGTYGTISPKNAQNATIADTIVMPVVTVDAYGEVTFSTANITANSPNDGIKITDGKIAIDYDTKSGLTMNSSNQLIINQGDGLKFNTTTGANYGKLQINAPTCTGNTQVLTWTGTAFSCVSGTDFNIQAEGGAIENIGDNETINFASDNNLTASRGTGANANTITYSLDDTGVVAGSYTPTKSAITNNTNGVNLNIPTFTVDAQGQLTAASTTALALTGGSGISINSSGQISAKLDTAKGLAFDTTTGNIYINNGNGLNFSSNKLQINAPTCTGNTQVLTWTGTAFSCVSGTDWSLAAQGTDGVSGAGTTIGDNETVRFQNGTGLTATRSSDDITYSLNNTTVSAGSYTTTGTATSGDYKFNIPYFTVNAQGQLTAASTTALALTGGAGISLNSSGNISMPGITDGTASCTDAGQGLTWTGSTFSCTTAYSWNLQANSANSTVIDHGETVNFLAAGSAGLSVAKGSANNTVTYTLNLSAGNGLTFSNGEFALKECTANGEVLKWNSTSHNWDCATFPVEDNKHIISGKVGPIYLRDYTTGTSYCWIGYNFPNAFGAGSFTEPPIVVATLTPEVYGAEVVEIHSTTTTGFSGNAHTILSKDMLSGSSATIDCYGYFTNRPTYINFIAYGK